MLPGCLEIVLYLLLLGKEMKSGPVVPEIIFFGRLKIESITGKAFHEVMHELIFEPLSMQNAFMHIFSKPKIASAYPTAKLYIKGLDLLSFIR